MKIATCPAPAPVDSVAPRPKREDGADSCLSKGRIVLVEATAFSSLLDQALDIMTST